MLRTRWFWRSGGVVQGWVRTIELLKVSAARPHHETLHRLCDRCNPEELTFPTVIELTRFCKHVKESAEFLSGISALTNVKTWIIVKNRASLCALFCLKWKNAAWWAVFWKFDNFLCEQSLRERSQKHCTSENSPISFRNNLHCGHRIDSSASGAS